MVVQIPTQPVAPEVPAPTPAAAPAPEPEPEEEPEEVPQGEWPTAPEPQQELEPEIEPEPEQPVQEVSITHATQIIAKPQSAAMKYLCLYATK